MSKELLNKIEESRYRLYVIDPFKKEKLLRESRKLDLLILEYYKQNTTNLKKLKEN